VDRNAYYAWRWGLRLIGLLLRLFQHY
jgi:hypothetical protein